MEGVRTPSSRDLNPQPMVNTPRHYTLHPEEPVSRVLQILLHSAALASLPSVRAARGELGIPSGQVTWRRGVLRHGMRQHRGCEHVMGK